MTQTNQREKVLERRRKMTIHTNHSKIGASSYAAHSKIGASTMSRWAKCPGSVKLSDGIKVKESAFAAEGTLAHEIAANYLKTLKWPDSLDDEMKDHLETYVNYVLDLQSSKGKYPKPKLYIEHGFDLSEIYPGCFGTADAVIYAPATKILTVVDLKYGAGLPVEVENNSQLNYYALGALTSLKLPVTTVESVIVQPRCPHKDGPIRKFTQDAIELMEFSAELVRLASLTEDPVAPLVPGDHCRFCPAGMTFKCPAVQLKSQQLAKLEFGKAETVEAIKQYNPEKLSEVLGYLPMMETWIENVRKFAYEELSSGKKVPGYKLVAKRATRKWIDETTAEKYLIGEFPQVREHFFDPPTFKSVAQIEKVLNKKQHEKLKPFIQAVSSGNTLVPVSDARPEVTVLDAKKEFELLQMLE